MIRILHTGDWHIGQTLRGFSREHEHMRVFDALVDIVNEQAVDALVVAGDVFDTQNPSGEAQRLFYDLLVRLHRARPSMTTVITAGNHDAAGRLEAPRPLLDAIGVHVIGNVRRLDGKPDISQHLVPVWKDGAVAAHVLALSYPTAACLPGISARDQAGNGSPIVRAVRDLYAEFYEAARTNLGGLPLLVTGHLHVAGGIESEGAERRILVGGEHAVPSDVFPEGADYVALGHLHRAQQVGRPSVRYCGSLIPLSATELTYRHGVSLVTLEDGDRARIDHVEIPRPVAFIRLPEVGEATVADLGDHFGNMGLGSETPVEQMPFVQVRLAREGLPAGYRAEVDRIAEGFPVRVVDVRVSTPVPDSSQIGGDAKPLVRLAECDPEELFRLAFARAHGVPPNPAHFDVFHRVRTEASA